MDEQIILLYAALIGSGLAAGFLNTIAGGGSMLTLPALMLLGMPADLANGTNRLSVVATSTSGVWGFARGGKLDRAAVIPVLLPTVVGSLLGSAVASQVPAATLKVVLLATMLLMAVVMAVRPQVIAAPEDARAGLGPRRLVGFLGLFAAGLYGGFIQAGVGFVLLAVLGGALRYDLVRANALKLICTFVFGAVSLVVFVIADQVVWVPAVLLAAGTAVGAQLAVRFALRSGQQALRWVVFATIVATCVAAFFKG
jgi:hypothetical protein